MNTLKEHGFLEKDAVTRKYRIGLRAFEVGRLYINRYPFAQIAIETLQEELPEYTSFAGILVEAEVVVLAAAEGRGTIKIGAHPGERRLAHCTALGKALLAKMDEADVERLLRRIGLPRVTPATITSLPDLLQDLRATRKRGYSINNEESLSGVISLGTVVEDAFDRPLGAVSISAPKFLIKSKEILDLGHQLRNIAGRLKQRLDKEHARFHSGSLSGKVPAALGQ
jgi:IclR family acetate operon transcriptional repressor